MKILLYRNDDHGSLYVAIYHGLVAYGYGRMQAISNMLGIIQMKLWSK